MKTLRQILGEMAAPAKHHQEMTFYHGTDGESGEKILKAGYLSGRETQGRAHLAPVKGKVYLTPKISYAQIYAIGGDMAGHDWWPSSRKNSTKTHDHAYVFSIKGHHLNDIQPDEDHVGEMTVRPNYKSESFENNGVHPHLKDMAKRVATPQQFKRASDGEYAYQSTIGKKMLKHMSDGDKLHLIDKGAAVAADGKVPIHRAWRIHKSKVKHLAKDGSNFFDHAEEVPVHHQDSKS